MHLQDVAEWSVLALALVTLLGLLGIGAGKVLVLMEKVYLHEYWISQLWDALLAQEQADEFWLLRDRMDIIAYGLDRLNDQITFPGLGVVASDESGEVA
ncbi:MAG: hypothetical protein JWN03_1476 [Nocardia sp.]|uniref:hypothetical protein n=1 Tax=Nocardia sp. TaxID=1821 RepID=UPI00260A3EDA|nr:hypothetical protein [Nocardia sp.]MCU1641201.1 hypothetical protein [Nocardia sp.]